MASDLTGKTVTQCYHRFAKEVFSEIIVEKIPEIYDLSILRQRMLKGQIRPPISFKVYFAFLIFHFRYNISKIADFLKLQYKEVNDLMEEMKGRLVLYEEYIYKLSLDYFFFGRLTGFRTCLSTKNYSIFFRVIDLIGKSQKMNRDLVNFFKTAEQDQDLQKRTFN